MGQGAERTGIKKLIGVLHRITRAAQIIPFVYSAMYIVVLFTYNFAPERILTILDILFYVSPVVIAAHLVYSHILELCKWHRAACVIPLAPQVLNVFDSYVMILTENEVLVFNLLVVFMTILLLVSAYKVFFCDERKNHPVGNT